MSYRKNIFSRIVFSSFFGNLYYFILLHFWLLLSIIGAGVGIAFVLIVLEWMFPKDVHIVNYALTNRTFTELYQNHNYHAAIFVAENDTSYVNDDPINFPNKDMLKECYIHVGEYSKAEKIGTEFLNFNPTLSDVSSQNKEQAKFAIELTHAIAARDLFRLYEKMGDKEKQLLIYKKLCQSYNNNKFDNFERLVQENGIELPYADKENSSLFSISHNLKYDIICGMYIENQEAAIDSLHNYIEGVWSVPTFSASLKLKIINKLLSWHIERNELLIAQMVLINGIDIVKTIIKEEDLDPLGEFAEYCYILHDYKNARRFMKVYMRYMDKYYSDDDLDYLLAEIRYIKYQDDNLESQVQRLAHCCEGIREQISKNFAGMTSEQQDYFEKKLDEPFTYALALLNKNYNNKDLIELCFENEVFKRGLLMRSDALVRRALINSKDKTLLKDYEQYLLYKRELIAREDVVGPGNFAQKLFLRNKVQDLESKLSKGVSEFARSNYEIADISSIKSGLPKDCSLVLYVDIPDNSESHLSAFVLNKSNNLSYVRLNYFKKNVSNVADLCTNSKTYEALFSQIENYVHGTKNILYAPSGIVNRIPLASLSIDRKSVLGDKYNMHVIANPTEIVSQKSSAKFEIRDQMIAMWGGIDYGNSLTTTNEEALTTRAVVRGKSLEPLKGSMMEINSLSSILSDKVKEIHCYTGKNATEGVFKQRASNADIIHISTHGFFIEDSSHKMSNAMHNSGLFFANANKAWKDEFRPIIFNKSYEDGILRAEEIETLNLVSCKLVVLSACETGLGEINGSEGVYGLQRAFKLAGAEYILMSLWPVPDLATSELMKRFYKYLVDSPSVEDAFAKAQKSMRKDPNHIYNVIEWGGFVLLH